MQVVQVPGGHGVVGHEHMIVRGQEVAGGLTPEERHASGNAFALRDGRHIRGGLDSKRRNPTCDEVLEQIPVVAGQLDHLVIDPEAPPRDHLLGVGARVRDPAVRIRREIGVVGKNRLGLHVFLKLHEKAVVTDEHMQRVERLHAVQLVGAQEAFTQGRHPEIHERMTERRVAMPAAARAGARHFFACGLNTPGNHRIHHARISSSLPGCKSGYVPSRSEMTVTGSGQRIASSGSFHRTPPAAEAS